MVSGCPSNAVGAARQLPSLRESKQPCVVLLLYKFPFHSLAVTTVELVGTLPNQCFFTQSSTRSTLSALICGTTMIKRLNTHHYPFSSVIRYANMAFSFLLLRKDRISSPAKSSWPRCFLGVSNNFSMIEDENYHEGYLLMPRDINSGINLGYHFDNGLIRVGKYEKHKLGASYVSRLRKALIRHLE